MPGTAMTALEFLQNSPASPEKPLPDPPSPTLSNIDLVLPSQIHSSPSIRLPSSPVLGTQVRPSAASATAIRHFAQARQQAADRRIRGPAQTVDKSKDHANEWAGPWNVPSDAASMIDDDATERGSITSDRELTTVASSPPVAQNNAFLTAPMRTDNRRSSSGGSSFNSDDSYKNMPNFMAKYQEHVKAQSSSEDEMWERESNATLDVANVSVIEDGIEMQRRIQEEDEQASAILSKRAERILANAKKRLNLMEGNLRGARDLVAPLTAANLRRATSLGSSYHAGFSPGRPAMGDDMDALSTHRAQPLRTLHAQASSPAMARDFQSHARGYSDNEIPAYPDRPHTALARPMNIMRRMPVRLSHDPYAHNLRGTRSYDSLSNASREHRAMHSKNSSDSPLEPLPEDEVHDCHSSTTSSSVRRYAANPSRSTATPDDLRSQMDSLKGKISSLRKRATEDRMKRQSTSSLKSVTPLNNASDEAPEFFYTQSASSEAPTQDATRGAGPSSLGASSPRSPAFPQPVSGADQSRSSSRNAFAEAVAAGENGSQEAKAVAENMKDRSHAAHTRTASGTVVINTVANRMSHHAASNVVHEAPLATQAPHMARHDTEDDVTSIDGDSVYEDAQDGTEDEDDDTQSLYTAESNVVPHEARQDAFDYQQFWMHSTIGTYGRSRRGSSSSEETISSAGTARGPTAPVVTVEEDSGDDEFFDGPRTPERLKRIEKTYRHRRTHSNGSTDTVNTFATATEGRSAGHSRYGSAMSFRTGNERPSTGFDRDRPSTAFDRRSVSYEALTAQRPSTAFGQSSTHDGERPKTAVKRPAIIRTDSDSDRADSGVGFSKQQNKKFSARPLDMTLSTKRSLTHLNTPPASPTDPTTAAVKAIVDQSKRSLGLKDNALLFGVVEGLRKVCSELQHEDESSISSRALRKKLEDIRRILDTPVSPDPSTSS